MVFFTCNACGESLKKAQVDKHVSMCRGCQVLSCIDCGKDFWGDDYKNHIKCISEDQKYGGKGYEAKSNKGDVKQHQWIQKIHEAMNKPGVSAKLKDVLKQVSAYDNVPRKKAKFENWMKNSLRITNSSLHEDVWTILNSASDSPPSAPLEKKVQGIATEGEMNSSHKKQNGHSNTKQKKLTKQEARQQANGNVDKKSKKAEMAVVEEEQLTKKKKKERKRLRGCEEIGSEDQDGASEQIPSKKIKSDQTEVEVSELTEVLAASKGNFKWKETIKAVLRNSPDQELPVKKLRKKVLAAYFSITGDGNFKKKEEVLALFNKKINNNPRFKVLKDRVRLVN
ncbi:transmembrane protein 128 isoform X1 [Corythoichthys intestinalis]|uniref:transmembrane protein 128 isoform X1 n=1 Tax=Corythoichthys intestinalis TaxID=161448 RepID=UPI0025A633E4|nr:transmembrane protein 128 isoform X1 [Corythoichthys intestinalis]XP_061814138.1 cell growth-regulating nucleolar protein [Nerophis lumbriciformis]